MALIRLGKTSSEDLSRGSGRVLKEDEILQWDGQGQNIFIHSRSPLVSVP